ncbi:MAG: DUF3012 domain-containing protein [Gammaproteobacteria bacterium]|nr:DUF3012 domain-containing protein [Gammaproteobacteria bacterium]NIN60995.1 DUF3012 domain-containing protein [Gammaproteobacteria bacterium]NIO62619.1 DUF3012 domain-containing protein [Gammaproteobacteria bacterium]NIP49464.1 DUF3012 domain-containing protein [Gammaproteobacteria bacterium]NIQ10688.1 DUF3012 domain-containing protein [Gammaproteobacteria bacterium]
MKIIILSIYIVIMLLLIGCSPEVGTEAWCNDLSEKPKGEWTSNEAADYTRHCLFR